MNAKLKSLILRARADHDCRAGATAAQIAAAEKRLGYEFTDDLRELLLACNGIQFWKAGDYPCALLATTKIKPAHLLLANDEGPRGLIAIVETEGTLIAIDLDRDSKSYSKIIDCFHETFPEELCGVCDSLQDLLALILNSRGEEWVWPAAQKYDLDFAE